MQSMSDIIERDILVKNEAETCILASEVARWLRPGDVVTLQGTLGVGKTSFSRACIRAMVGDKDLEVASPTFALVQTYEAEIGEIWHCDLYRLEQESEVLELGIEDAFDYAVVLIEWPELSLPLLPKNKLEIIISSNDLAESDVRHRGNHVVDGQESVMPSDRKISIRGYGRFVNVIDKEIGV